ncbi:PepSY domain-containing protein [Psychrobacter sp. FDAARGOS_221]|uniref:PepSY domain-containing protein n=1 Tax=Psychrobacter sp. FDAARGOS_221 TaxID=1975705 RepID=UPI000BB577EF|nr:PepSY domain-containing protein [Psychrobacter sp. FDAARGOS_221]PNK59621.1 hypothetical protein A6J60_001130 [Psychrobacter sp. FDAARGOS_221]
MSKITSQSVTKPIIFSIGIASLVFFGGAVGLTLQSAETALEQNASAQTTLANLTSNDMALGLDADQSTDQSIAAMADLSSQRLIAISSEQALTIAKPQHTDASLIGTPELVNYNGNAAYEVKWTDGVTYVDAALGTIINPVNQTVLVSGSQYEEGYENGYEEDDDEYDDDDDEDEHHESYERHEHSERLMVANYEKHDDDEDEYDD